MTSRMSGSTGVALSPLTIALRVGEAATEGHPGDHRAQRCKSDLPEAEDPAIAEEDDRKTKGRQLVQDLRYNGEHGDGEDEKKDVENP